jgi:hypothetical protein
MNINFNRLCSLLALLCLPVLVRAQDTLFSDVPGTKFADIIALMKADTAVMNDTGEGGRRIKLLDYEHFWTSRIYQTDSSGVDMFTQYYQALHDALEGRFGAAKSSSGCSGSGFSGAWEPLGPLEMDYQVGAVVNCVWAKPDQSVILAGTGGGLYKTTDQGAHWECLTDNIPISAGITQISSIAVHPTNSNEIWISTMNDKYRVDHATAGIAYGTHYGAGMFVSYDGGSSWEQVTIIDELDCVSRVYFSSETDNTGSNSGNYWIYACVNPALNFQPARIYRSPWANNTGSLNWTDITAGSYLQGTGVSGNPQFCDIEFVPGSHGNRIFVSNVNSDGGANSAIFECNISWNGSAYVYNWGADRITRQANNFPDSTTNFVRFSISIPKNDVTDHYMYAVGMMTPVTRIRLYRYDLNTGGQWKIVRSEMPNAYWPSTVSRYRCDLTVSPANCNNAYFTANAPYFTDSLKTAPTQPNFHIIGSYWPAHISDSTTWDTFLPGNNVAPEGPTHCDVRGHWLIPHFSGNATNDVFLYASDGGVSRKAAGVPMTPATITNGTRTYWASRSINGHGLAAAHVWATPTTENGGNLVSGAFHN